MLSMGVRMKALENLLEFKLTRAWLHLDSCTWLLSVATNALDKIPQITQNSQFY